MLSDVIDGPSPIAALSGLALARPNLLIVLVIAQPRRAVARMGDHTAITRAARAQAPPYGDLGAAGQTC